MGILEGILFSVAISLLIHFVIAVYSRREKKISTQESRSGIWSEFEIDGADMEQRDR